MKNSFDFNRFGALASAYYISNGYSNMLKVVALVAFCSMMYLFSWTMGASSAQELIATRVLIFIVAYFVWIYSVSRSFSTYFNRGSASSALMLPAARGEKFTLAAVDSLVVVPLAIGAVILLNDVVWTYIMDAQNMIVIEKFSPENEKHAFGIVSLFISLFITVGTFYFLGAVFFRRHQFLYTLISSFVLSSVLWSIVAKIIIVTGISSESDFVLMMSDKGEVYNVTIGLIFHILMAAALLFFAWRCFKNLQITK